jgi:cupin 2 domain-containing protein
MNIYDVSFPSKGEVFKTLHEKNGVLIEQIVSSDKLEKKVYVQSYDEWLVLLEGEATLRVAKKNIYLRKGDTLLIEKNVPHEVLSTENGTLWLCVHMKKEANVS